MSESFLDGKVILRRGDCLGVLPTLEENSIDSVVCDPPYHLVSIVKRFGAANSAPINNADEKTGRQGPYHRASKGFMGKQWDGGGIAFNPETWALVLRVLKPGGHLLAFSGTRTYHRMACAIEDAGFEIRDQIAWTFGSGFPKSHNIGNGWGSALKPAWEPICLARKPLSESSIAANVLKHGTGGINIDGCRVETVTVEGGSLAQNTHLRKSVRRAKGESIFNTSNEEQSFSLDAKGRWPANLIHDGSEEVLAGFPDSSSTPYIEHDPGARLHDGGIKNRSAGGFSDSGSAARFFYTAKADADDRLGSKHPTIKPLDLMQWLVRLVTPKGGAILDPFAGTGTTGEAAWREGMRSILIEREAEYQADIVKRIGLCLAGQDKRRAASVKQETAESLPLFGGI